MRAQSLACLCPAESAWGAPGVSMQGNSKLTAFKEPGRKMRCLLQTQPRVPLSALFRAQAQTMSGVAWGSYSSYVPPPPHQSIRNQVGPTTLRQPHSPRDERLRPPAAQQGHRKAQCQFLSYPRKTSNALLISDQCLRTFRQVVSNHCGLHHVCCDVVAGNTGQQCFPNKESNETSVVATHLAPGRCPQEQWEPRL